jgi:reductive dehalogenase
MRNKNMDIVYRQRKKRRYPWWVKTVDQITTETDKARLSKPQMNFLMHRVLVEGEKAKAAIEQSKDVVAGKIRDKVPGYSVRDLALHYAANTYQSGTIGSLGDPVFNPLPGLQEIQNTWKLHPPQSLGLPAWEASPQVAAETVEKAAVQLGSPMIGITTINPDWLSAGVEISPDVDEVTADGMTRILPERLKYVISVIGVCPPDLTLRSQTELGAAGDRAGYEAFGMATTRLLRFIKGLGYTAIDGISFGPQIPHAIASGLGELGRMNRMINPIFGGNVRLGTIFTDLPLAIDKPIDFGLQRFCVGCKKCATECPPQALSLEDHPVWEPFNQWQAGGKKAYFEDNQSCGDFQLGKDLYCSTCLSVCPWSKQDKTALHELAHIMGAKLPFLSGLLTKMDDLFGYGRISEAKKLEEWWGLDNPVRGVDSSQGR